MLRDITARGRPHKMVSPPGGLAHEWPPFRDKLRQAWIAGNEEFDGGGVCTWRSFGLNGEQKNGVSPSAARSPVQTTVNGAPALVFSAAGTTTCDCGALGAYPVLPSDGSDHVLIIIGQSNTTLGMIFAQYVAGGAEFAGRTLSGNIGGAVLQYSPGNVTKNQPVLKDDFQVALWRVEGNNVYVRNALYNGGDSEIDRGAGANVSNVGNVIGGRSSSTLYGPATTQYADGTFGGVIVYNRLSGEQCRSVIRELGRRWGLLT